MGIAIGDWDNDGAPDIFVTHWIYQKCSFPQFAGQTPAIA